MRGGWGWDRRASGRTAAPSLRMAAPNGLQEGLGRAVGALPWRGKSEHRDEDSELILEVK